MPSLCGGKDQQDAFSIIQEQLKVLPNLAYADQNSDYLYVIETDASNYSIAAVLKQQFEGGERLISCWGRGLSKSEANYSTNDKELLSILSCILKYQHLIAGKKLEIRSENITALAFQRLKTSNLSRAKRWAVYLSCFLDNDRTTCTHLRGSQNTLADALSRVVYAQDSEPLTKLEKELLSDDYNINTLRSDLIKELNTEETDSE